MIIMTKTIDVHDYSLTCAIRKIQRTIIENPKANKIIIIHGFYNFPIVMRICSDSWQQLPVDEKNAATMLGANSFRIFRTVTFFQLLPAISSSAIMAFLYSFFSFIIVLLF